MPRVENIDPSRPGKFSSPSKFTYRENEAFSIRLCGFAAALPHRNRRKQDPGRDTGTGIPRAEARERALWPSFHGL
jgi:hypothetical protein